MMVEIVYVVASIDEDHIDEDAECPGNTEKERDDALSLLDVGEVNEVLGVLLPRFHV